MTLPSQPTQPRAATAIDRIANEYTERLLELDPGFATQLGRPGHESEYRDHSPAGLAAMADAARDTLAALAAAAPVDAVDAVTVHAMQERLGLEVELHETGWPLADLNNIASPAQGIRAIFDLMPTATATDWRHIAERMANVPAAVGGYIASLRAGAERGLVASARQVNIVIGQCQRHAAADGFFTTLAQQAELDAAPETSGTDASDAGRQLPADLAEALAANAEIARGGYGTLVAFLRGELLPQAPEEDAVGRERYQLA